jgi:hypothetical protein
MLQRYVRRILGLMVLTTASPHDVQAESALATIPIGVSRIDLDGDGRQEMIVRAWRENFNAHGFFISSFYSEDPYRQALVAGRALPAALGVIPIERADTKEFVASISTEQGAECLLRDFRLLPSDQGMLLVEALRRKGHANDDRQSVLFTIYQIRKNEDGLPGLPDAYFSSLDQYETEGTYCDVTDAFDTEGYQLLRQ